MTWGLGFFIALMLWIIWDLARKSNAGKFATMQRCSGAEQFRAAATHAI